MKDKKSIADVLGQIAEAYGEDIFLEQRRVYAILYDLAPGLRYADAIRKAGGMTDEADETRVNLAKKIKDGCQVNVPLRKKRRLLRATCLLGKKRKGKIKAPLGS